MTETQDPNRKAQVAEKVLKKPVSKLEERRAQNLRDNLLKRKQQARARAIDQIESYQPE